MAEVGATGWSLETSRRYTPTGRDRPREYRLFRHRSGDVRLQLAPTDHEGIDRPGYAIHVTVYPNLEIAASSVVRTVLRYDRARELAGEFMAIFSTVYDGAGTVERAAVYAARQVGGLQALEGDLSALEGDDGDEDLE